MNSTTLVLTCEGFNHIVFKERKKERNKPFPSFNYKSYKPLLNHINKSSLGSSVIFKGRGGPETQNLRVTVPGNGGDIMANAILASQS